MKVLCYGVRDVEKPIFEQVNKKFKYDMTCVPHLLTLDNVAEVEGYDALLLRANCVANRENLEIIKNTYGINYVFTRTAGVNHIDLEAAKELGISVGYVPMYSPNAIAELAVAFTMDLARHSLIAAYNASQLDFSITNYMFSKEIRNSVIGIVGLGNIGLTSAKLFHGLGATILGYDVVDKDVEFIEQVSLDELAARADVIVIHCPYIPGVNDHLINADLIQRMKNDVIIVNVARGELVDIQAVVAGIDSGKVHGFATDVIANEPLTFGKKFTDATELVPEIADLVRLYPKALISPHIGSYTDEAVLNMVEYSFENLEDVLNGKKTKRILV